MGRLTRQLETRHHQRDIRRVKRVVDDAGPNRTNLGEVVRWMRVASLPIVNNAHRLNRWPLVLRLQRVRIEHWHPQPYGYTHLEGRAFGLSPAQKHRYGIALNQR